MTSQSRRSSVRFRGSTTSRRRNVSPRRYGEEFILFELVNAVTSVPGVGDASGRAKPSVAYKTVDQYLSDSPEVLRALYEDLRAQLVSMGDDVQEKHLKYYVAFKRIRNFACVEVHPQSKKLLVFVKVDPDTVDLSAGFSRDVRKIGHFGTGDLEITIASRADLEGAVPLVEQSYEAS